MDWRQVIITNAELIALAERRAMDEPPLREDGPAHRAASAALRCLQSLSADDARDPSVAGYLWINRANALRLCGPGYDEQSQQAFEHALALDSDNGWWWYDLALLHKWRGRFAQGYDCNLKARARLGDERRVLWNLAICATAVGDGNVAAGIWAELGMNASTDSKSGMPFVDGLPHLLLRVLSRGVGHAGSALPHQTTGFEVVSVGPLSPCHGVVQTPTFGDAPIDYGDVVLWDGAPVATRSDEQPVFALLEILRRGQERRWPFVGLRMTGEEVRLLRDAIPAPIKLFTQHEHIELSCPHCAEGTEVHDHQPPDQLVYGKLIAPEATALADVRDSWEGAQKRHGLVFALPGLYEALGDSKQAGQAHQAWGGIERRAAKRVGR